MMKTYRSHLKATHSKSKPNTHLILKATRFNIQINPSNPKEQPKKKHAKKQQAKP